MPWAMDMCGRLTLAVVGVKELLRAVEVMLFLMGYRYGYDIVISHGDENKIVVGRGGVIKAIVLIHKGGCNIAMDHSGPDDGLDMVF